MICVGYFQMAQQKKVSLFIYTCMTKEIWQNIIYGVILSDLYTIFKLFVYSAFFVIKRWGESQGEK